MAGQAVSPTSHTVRLGTLDVHYLETGSGHPLLLLHGGTATAAAWSEQLPALAARYRVIAPDTRGHGRTNNPDMRLSYAQYADDAAALIDALGLKAPLVVGYSDGGQAALELALRHPGKAAALVLGGTAWRPTPAYLAGLKDWGFPAPGEVDLQRLRSVWGDYLDSLKTAHAHHHGPDYWRSYLDQLSELWLTLPTYTAEQLASITTPALVISGDRDHMADAGEMARFFGQLGAGELATVPGAGHEAVDNPIFLQLVLDFLARHAPVS
jgi:pimeloyl-ACP methyl ester carboxylesterase